MFRFLEIFSILHKAISKAEIRMSVKILTLSKGQWSSGWMIVHLVSQVSSLNPGGRHECCSGFESILNCWSQFNCVPNMTVEQQTKPLFELLFNIFFVHYRRQFKICFTNYSATCLLLLCSTSVHLN